MGARYHATMALHGTITSLPILLQLLQNADARLKLLRAEHAAAGDIADEAADVRHYYSQVSFQAKDSMPQTVFKSAFWRRLVDFCDAIQLDRREFFEAFVEACQMLQTVPAPRAARLVFWRQAAQEHVAVVVGGVKVASIVYRRSGGRILVDDIIVPAPL